MTHYILFGIVVLIIFVACLLGAGGSPKEDEKDKHKCNCEKCKCKK